jgi:hypothetical protein
VARSIGTTSSCSLRSCSRDGADEAIRWAYPMMRRAQEPRRCRFQTPWLAEAALISTRLWRRTALRCSQHDRAQSSARPMGSAAPADSRRSKARRTAIEPSPMAAATRLTEPLRTSPTANTPGLLVSRNNGVRFRPPAGRPGYRRRSRETRACPRRRAADGARIGVVAVARPSPCPLKPLDLGRISSMFHAP